MKIINNSRNLKSNKTTNCHSSESCLPAAGRESRQKTNFFICRFNKIIEL